MKRILGLLGLMGLISQAPGQSMQYVDTTTRTTFPISSSGFLSVSNPAGGWIMVQYYFLMTNPVFTNIGDLTPTAFAKLNSDIFYLSTAVRTNGSSGNGRIPMISNTVAGGYAWVAIPTGGGGWADTNLSNISSAGTDVIASVVLAELPAAVNTNGSTGNGQIPMTSNTVAGGYAWVPIPTGGGGLSNAIADFNGFGTNTSLFGLTWLDNSNLSISQQLGGTSTNYVYFSIGNPFAGLYRFNAASNGYVCAVGNEFITNDGTGKLYLPGLSTVFYQNTAGSFPGTANSWTSPAGPPYSSYTGTVMYTNAEDVIASDGTLDLSAPFGVLVNGQPIGAPVFTNTTQSAGVVAGLGVGTNLYWAATATTATNDPNGNPIASLQAATNAAAGMFSGAISNWYGTGTNLTLYAAPVTNYSYNLTTNGNVVVGTYQVVEWQCEMLPLTNAISIWGSSLPNINGVYVWQPAAAGYNATIYDNDGNRYSTWIDYSGGQWSIYDANADYFNAAAFPISWGTASGGSGPPPSGSFILWGYWMSVTNTYQVFLTLDSSNALSGSTPALDSFGLINAPGYQVNGLPLQAVLQGMQWPYLWVTNCSGVATQFQGVYQNTWSGFYTNQNGSLLVPPGYWGDTINGTNFTTPCGILCSNLASVLSGYQSYGNRTNVLGYYSLNPGNGIHMATNQPLVTAWNPGVTTNLTGTWNGGTHTAYFTNGVLTGLQ